MRAIVTTHALERWRQRVAEYGDARWPELVKAFEEAKKIPDDESIPFKRDAGFHYYHHAPTKSYFVARQTDIETSTILTVIVPGQPDPIMADRNVGQEWTAVKQAKASKRQQVKEKKARAWKEAQERGAVNAKRALERATMTVTIEEPPYRDIIQRRAWLKMESAALATRLAANIDAEDERHCIKMRLTAVIDLIKATKLEYLEFRKQEDEKANVALYRSDGTINFQAAARMLLEKVEKQEQEIADLRRRVEQIEWLG